MKINLFSLYSTIALVFRKLKNLSQQRQIADLMGLVELRFMFPQDQDKQKSGNKRSCYQNLMAEVV